MQTRKEINLSNLDKIQNLINTKKKELEDLKSVINQKYDLEQLYSNIEDLKSDSLKFNTLMLVIKSNGNQRGFYNISENSYNRIKEVLIQEMCDQIVSLEKNIKRVEDIYLK